MTETREIIARAICRERCAYPCGEPPCFEVGAADFDCEGDHSCAGLAGYALTALSEAGYVVARDAEIAALRARIAEKDGEVDDLRGALVGILEATATAWTAGLHPDDATDAGMSIIDSMLDQLNDTRRIARKALEG